MRETGKETQMKDTTMKDTTRATISRRELVTAASIVPFAAVRGSAQNSAVTVGLIGCGGRGTHDGMTLAKNVPGARVGPLGLFIPKKDGGGKEGRRGAGRKGVRQGHGVACEERGGCGHHRHARLPPPGAPGSGGARGEAHLHREAGRRRCGGVPPADARRRLGGPQTRYHLRVPAALRRRVPEGEKAGRVERYRADCDGSFLLGEEPGGLRAPDRCYPADNGAGNYGAMARVASVFRRLYRGEQRTRRRHTELVPGRPPDESRRFGRPDSDHGGR